MLPTCTLNFAKLAQPHKRFSRPINPSAWSNEHCSS